MGRRIVFAIAGLFACCFGGCAGADPTQDDGTIVSDTPSSDESALTASYACGLPAGPTSGVAKPSGSATNLKVLNWAGFKGAVSYTFDDANSSQIAHFSELNALGVPMTFYLQTGKTDASNAVWKQALASGHELGNHTKSHLQAGTGADVDAATQFIQQTFGVKPVTMAAPYGDTSYVSLAQSRFLLNRGVGGGTMAPNDSTDPFNLKSFIPATGALASAFNSTVDAARKAGTWQVVLVHGFAGGTDGAYQPVAINEFVTGVKYAKSLKDMWLGTMKKVGAYWRAQKLLSSTTPTTSGQTQTWKWTLPTNFPSGQCLRVTVNGGKLTQNGATLPWNSRGYYEVSLDAKSLTLAP